MIKLASLMIGSKQPKVMAEFYEKVFEKPADLIEAETWFTWKIGNLFISFGEHSEVADKAEDPKRNILNYETEDVQKEFDRIKGYGAEVIKEPYEMGGAWIATLADPDGNYFQLMTPWESEKLS
jgi:predicted enzyme related to lactoylglutathione lyase